MSLTYNADENYYEPPLTPQPTWDLPCTYEQLGRPEHNLDKFIEAMFQSVSPAATTPGPGQIVALQQIQALMALQLQQNNIFPKVDDHSSSPTPEMASPSAKRIKLSPNTSNHSDVSVASTSKGVNGEAKKSPKIFRNHRPFFFGHPRASTIPALGIFASDIPRRELLLLREDPPSRLDFHAPPIHPVPSSPSPPTPRDSEMDYHQSSSVASSESSTASTVAAAAAAAAAASIHQHHHPHHLTMMIDEKPNLSALYCDDGLLSRSLTDMVSSGGYDSSSSALSAAASMCYPTPDAYYYHPPIPPQPPQQQQGFGPTDAWLQMQMQPTYHNFSNTVVSTNSPLPNHLLSYGGQPSFESLA
ncbi:hypothetical protein CRE_16914 [Caenorhabditis remanei]|uniref:Uncharacterized protein n=1 Tax=Caenorhabditis remanei TaxID=31234 RepID=E3MSD3_CAERE|nr:hypothetical protein CRE_16914 [Caenorhabditis remanei]